MTQSVVRDAVLAILELHDDQVWCKWAKAYLDGRPLSEEQATKVLARTYCLWEMFCCPSQEFCQKMDRNPAFAHGMYALRLILSAASMVVFLVLDEMKNTPCCSEDVALVMDRATKAKHLRGENQYRSMKELTTGGNQ